MVAYTDQDLVKGCKRNDRKSQELLYRKYFAAMMRMCMRYTKDQEVAIEIINNGFLRAFKKIDKYAGKGSLEGWIRKLVFHAISDYFRGKNNPVYFLELEDRDSVVQGEALHNLYYEDLLDLVELLPDATRRVFCLYAIEGYSHAEIAEQTNISVGTSKWHLSEARKKLQLLIRKQLNAAQNAG